MLESNVHYLHQFPQVQEDAVDLDNKSYDGVRNELILGNTIRQATNHLQYSYTHTTDCSPAANYSVQRLNCQGKWT